MRYNRSIGLMKQSDHDQVLNILEEKLQALQGNDFDCDDEIHHLKRLIHRYENTMNNIRLASNFA